MTRLIAPWSDELVEKLNRHQRESLGHPYTCGGDRMDDAHKKYATNNELSDCGILIATTRGWFCPVCAYTQNWVHG